jgi:hypothetical protein
MPLPAPLKDAIRRKEFWIGYILEREDAEWPTLGRSCRITVPVGGGYEIVIGLSRYLSVTDLYLRRPGVRKLYWMGRDDLAYWPREVLRWEETELISRAAALRDREFPHPGLLLLFLYRFTPLTAGDNRKAIHAEMRRAFNSLGILSERIIARCTREGASDLHDDFVWSQDEKCGWVLRQKDQDHYWEPRCPDGKFPFTHFDALLNAAQRTCSRSKK